MSVLLLKTLIIGSIFAITLVIAMYSTYAERKVAAFIQDRIGPDRAGLFGILQPLADGIKMFMKEDFVPSHANKWLFILGPSIAMTTALLTSAVIPFGETLRFGNLEVPVQGMEVNIGILWVMGIVSLGVYGVMIGGWASNNKYSLLGAIRAASQNISYELAMGLSVLALVMMASSLSLSDIIQSQKQGWNIMYQPLGFIIFLVCAFAECNRTPFDLPECETELIGGYHTEYSSMKLGFYLFAEYINMFVSSAVMAGLYFGGYNYPGMEWVATQFDSSDFSHNILTFIGVGVYFLKIFFFIFVFIWVRWTIPRFRYDQLLHLGWYSLIPLSIYNILLTGVAFLSPNPLLVSWVGFFLLIIGAYIVDYFQFKKEAVSHL